jgi:CarD family transcriptional regulator
MMKFAVGDKIMHPNFGVGQITKETHRELVEGFEHYFVIEVMRTGATAYVPKRKMSELGVRMVMSIDEMFQVLDTLGSEPRTLAQDYKERQAKIEEQLDTRRPIPIAEAVRDLTWREQESHLTKRDGDLLAKGVELLTSEMAIASDSDEFEAQQSIDTALRFSLTRDNEEIQNAAAEAVAAK